MKWRKICAALVPFAAVCLSACGGGDAYPITGTSSESHSTLQALADDAPAMVGLMGLPTPGAGRVAARAGESSPCLSPWRSASYRTGKLGWTEYPDLAGADSSGRRCEDGENRVRVLDAGPSGLFEKWGVQADSSVAGNRNLFRGRGIWKLRSGSVYPLDTVVSDVNWNAGMIALRMAADLGKGCRVDLAMSSSLKDYFAGTAAGMDAPVVCGADTIGNFRWTFGMEPVVSDRKGSVFRPRLPASPVRFGEDSLGLRIEKLVVDSSAATWDVSGRVGGRMLPGDALQAGDTLAWDGMPAVLDGQGGFRLQGSGTRLKSGMVSVEVRRYGGGWEFLADLRNPLLAGSP